MIKPVTMYAIICDGCGQQLSYEDSIVAWTDKCSASAVAQDSEWLNIEGKHYCPSCYEYSEELDDYVPKEGGSDV